MNSFGCASVFGDSVVLALGDGRYFLLISVDGVTSVTHDELVLKGAATRRVERGVEK